MVTNKHVTKYYILNKGLYIYAYASLCMQSIAHELIRNSVDRPSALLALCRPGATDLPATHPSPRLPTITLQCHN